MRVMQKFLSRPLEEDIATLEKQWFNRTPTNLFKLPTCMVCAREIWDGEESKELDVLSIPNRSLLTPETYHPAHKLHCGMLLDMATVAVRDGSLWGKVCLTCLRDLEDAVPPVLSLANGSWVGAVPAALQGLTIAEQALIALHPHTTYHIGFRGDASAPVAFIRTRSVHPMAADSSSPLSSLPATLQVLSGAFDLEVPDGFRINDAVLHLLMVRRSKVRDALLWLKDHNHFYRNIELIRDRIRELPTRGVCSVLLQNQSSGSDLFHKHNQCMTRCDLGYIILTE